MPIYLAQGCLGDMHREMRRAMRVIELFYRDAWRQPVYLHAIRNGTNHLPHSLHPEGKAIDILYPTDVVEWDQLWEGRQPTGPDRVQFIHDLQEVIDNEYGKGKYQVVYHSFNAHVEYDPREGR